MTAVQILGGPHDGMVLDVPGDEPPLTMRVLDDQFRLVMDHPSRHVVGEDGSVPVLVLTRELNPSGHPPWRYRWPAFA